MELEKGYATITLEDLRRFQEQSGQIAILKLKLFECWQEGVALCDFWADHVEPELAGEDFSHIDNENLKKMIAKFSELVYRAYGCKESYFFPDKTPEWRDCVRKVFWII